MNDSGSGRPRLIDRWWVQLLVAGWIVAVLGIYFRLQIARLLEIAAGAP